MDYNNSDEAKKHSREYLMEPSHPEEEFHWNAPSTYEAAAPDGDGFASDDMEESDDDDEEIHRLQSTLKKLLDCAKMKAEQQKEAAREQFLKDAKQSLKKEYQVSLQITIYFIVKYYSFAL